MYNCKQHFLHIQLKKLGNRKKFKDPGAVDAMQKFVANVLLLVAYMVRQAVGQVGGQEAGSARGG